MTKRLNPDDHYYLFRIDLEDIRDFIPNGYQYKEKVPVLIKQYLDFLDRYNMKTTFFTVGLVAERYPELIKTLIDNGHEIACHSYQHRPLTDLTKDEFKFDLEKNLGVLYKSGAREVKGFRAPIFSLVEESQWAYDVMEEFDITYSSSVLPASNPLYGWPEFGVMPRMINNLWELPISVDKYLWKLFPFSGGIYFRIIPIFLIFRSFNKKSKLNQPVFGYIHPYDIDTTQEKYMHPGINNNKLFNLLMYYNRKKVIHRLEKLIGLGWNFVTYKEFAAQL